MKLTAVVLAAGLSARMGTPKMLLPWGTSTVLAHVLRTLHDAGVDDRVVVVGPERGAVDTICQSAGSRTVFNPEFKTGEMLSSLQVGLRSLAPDCEAALVVLGDQPLVESAAIRAVVDAFALRRSPLVVPSFQNRRGHPWLMAAALWPEMLRMLPPETPRDFMRRHSPVIEHVEWNTNSILVDIDTPEDYERARP